jgi:hypothetical protein
MRLIDTVDWNAVSAIAAVLTVIGATFCGAIRLLRTTPAARLRSRREQTAEAYLTKLKQSAKAVNDAADGRTSLASAQALFTALAEPEEELRLAFGNESAVHWIARLNRGMLGRGIDITNGQADS